MLNEQDQKVYNILGYLAKTRYMSSKTKDIFILRACGIGYYGIQHQDDKELHLDFQTKTLLEHTVSSNRHYMSKPEILTLEWDHYINDIHIHIEQSLKNSIAIDMKREEECKAQRIKTCKIEAITKAIEAGIYGPQNTP